MEIPLYGKYSNDNVALVSDEDYELVSKYRWNKTKNGYAKETVNGKKINMHRFIMNAAENETIHHKKNKLDNRKENLEKKIVYMKIRLYGEYCNGEEYALVSPEDYDIVSKYKWWKGQYGYARGEVDGKMVSMHRFIMKPPKDKVIDHISRNRLDNRRKKLKICTSQENSHNKSISKNKSSKYRGVFYNKRDKKYRTAFTYNKIYIYIGDFKNELDAAEAFDMYIVHKKIKEIQLNFPNKKKEYLKKDFKFNKYKFNNKYIGVYFIKQRNKYLSKIRLDKKTIRICYIDNELECAKAYDKYIVENNILYKKLNFPEDYLDYNKDPEIKTMCEKVDENTVRLIINSNKDAFVIIDREDYDKIKYFAWYISDGYIKAHINKKKVRLHRFLMNATDPNIYVDHMDGDPFDNRKEKLRFSNAQKNSQNKKKCKDASSKYFGVFYNKKLNKWKPFIKGKNMKYVNTEIKAARRRDIYILDDIPNSHFNMNFEWKDKDIEKWKKILNIKD